MYLYIQVQCLILYFIQTLGLRLFDAREMMQKNYRGFHNLLSVSSQKLTLDDMNDLLEVRFSEEGTNFRDKEIDVIYAWTNFLQDVEGTGQCRELFACRSKGRNFMSWICVYRPSNCLVSICLTLFRFNK